MAATLAAIFVIHANCRKSLRPRGEIRYNRPYTSLIIHNNRHRSAYEHGVVALTVRMAEDIV